MDEERMRPVWPRESGEAPSPAGDLPPSASRYGLPVGPVRRMPTRVPTWTLRLILSCLAAASAGVIVSGLALVFLDRDDRPHATTLTDALAGAVYTLPPGWKGGITVPVTGFTSAATHDDLATVMARPGEHVASADLRSQARELSDLYSRLLLHGDTVDVVDDRPLVSGHRPGYTRALRANYQDVVNQPAFLRVTLLTGKDGKSTVLLGLAHPDRPASRAELDAIMAAIR